MYYRTDRAAVDQKVHVSADRSQSPERTLWAKVPIQTPHGRCVALKLHGDQLLVGIAGAPAVQWLPVNRVLNEAQARSWLSTGFA
jgi:hypothetical protein